MGSPQETNKSQFGAPSGLGMAGGQAVPAWSRTHILLKLLAGAGLGKERYPLPECPSIWALVVWV